jgi:release factor glutamine methyltransferase
MKSVLEVLKSTAAYFTKAGVENGRLNIEHLLAHVLGKKQRMELYLEFDRPLSESELAPLRELVRRRAAGEPLQHLLGSVEFLGHAFKSDARALIPRPETELLAQKLIDRCKPAPVRFADIGTGSGVLALSLAAAWPEAEVHAVDVSPSALELARENALALGLTERVRFHEGSLLGPLEGSFQLIVANLPYIPSNEMPSLAREVQYDPVLALDGGPDGAVLIRELIHAARPCLQEMQGVLALEIGHDQSDFLAEFLAEAGYSNISQEKDYPGRNRFLFASYG